MKIHAASAPNANEECRPRLREPYEAYKFPKAYTIAPTMSPRRHNSLDVCDLTEMYTGCNALDFVAQKIIKEFQRLKPNTSSDDIEALLMDGLRKYRKAIVKLLNGKKKPEFLMKMEKTKSLYLTENQRNYADDCMTLAGLPLLFKEKPENLIIFQEVESEGKAISIYVKQKVLTMESDAFVVNVDGLKLCACDNFFEAFSALIASIYIFNLAYPKELTKSLTFIQNVIIGLKDSEGHINFDRKIRNVVSLINLKLKE
ncbi:hypothetical protein ScPMuIL_013137 [Solemya velum]